MNDNNTEYSFQSDPFLNPEMAGYRNIQAIKGYADQTREIVRELEEKVQRLENLILTYSGRMNGLQAQVASALQRTMNLESRMTENAGNSMQIKTFGGLKAGEDNSADIFDKVA